MFRITQGTPTELQVFVFAGIVLVLFTAPVLIFAAGLLGYLTRPPLAETVEPANAPVPESKPFKLDATEFAWKAQGCGACADCDCKTAEATSRETVSVA